MKSDISTVRKNLSAFINMSIEGTEVVVTRHGRPQVKLVPVTQDQGTAEEERPSLDDFLGMWSRRKKSGVAWVNELRAKGRRR